VQRVEIIGAVIGKGIVMLMTSLMLTGCYPPINDITTDPFDPLPLYRHGQQVPYPERFGDIQRKKYPLVRPRIFQVSPTELLEVIITVVKDETSWCDVRVDVDNLQLTAVAVSRLFRFRDDIVLQVRSLDGENEAIVHMRSRSRIGKSDLGVNARRITSLFREIEKRLQQNNRLVPQEDERS